MKIKTHHKGTQQTRQWAQVKFKVRIKCYSTLADNPDKYQRGFLFGNTSIGNHRGTNITTTKLWLSLI